MDSSTFIVQASQENTVLSIGRAPNPRGRLFIAGGIALLLTSLLLLGLWLLLRMSFAIPLETAVLVSVTPRVAHAGLSDRQFDQLPAIWKQALAGESHWPVILGAYPSDAGWRYFSLVPRWQAGGLRVREAHGAIALISDELLPRGGRSLSYLDQSDWWRSHTSALLVAWINPRILFQLGNGLWEADGDPFVAYIKNGAIFTDIVLEDKPPAPLRSVDLSLNLSQDTAPVVATTLLEEMGADDIPFSSLGLQPVQISMNYDGQTKPKSISIVFKDQINPSQARQLLGIFGLTDHRTSTLPDATTYNERFLPLNLDENGLYSAKNGTRYGSFQIMGNELRLGTWDESSLSYVKPKKICQGLEPWAHFSSHMVDVLLKPLGSFFSSSTASADIGAMKGRLAICLE